MISVILRQAGSVKKLKWDINFADILIKGRGSRGNIVTKYAIKAYRAQGKKVYPLSSLVRYGTILSYIASILRGRGELLGSFKGEDRLLLISKDAIVKTVIPDLSLHFDPNLLIIEKWNPEKPISVIHYEGEKERYLSNASW